MRKKLKFREFREQYLGGRSRNAVYGDIAAGRLPQPLKLGGNLYFDLDEVEAHLARMAEDQRARREVGAATGTVPRGL